MLKQRSHCTAAAEGTRASAVHRPTHWARATGRTSSQAVLGPTSRQPAIGSIRLIPAAPGFAPCPPSFYVRPECSVRRSALHRCAWSLRLLDCFVNLPRSCPAASPHRQDRPRPGK
jgi:hypothetical protein